MMRETIPGGERYCPDCGHPMTAYSLQLCAWRCPRHPRLWVTDEAVMYAVRAIDISTPEPVR